KKTLFHQQKSAARLTGDPGDYRESQRKRQDNSGAPQYASHRQTSRDDTRYQDRQITDRRYFEMGSRGRDHDQKYEQRQNLYARVTLVQEARSTTPLLEDHMLQLGAPLAAHHSPQQRTCAVDESDAGESGSRSA